MHPSTRTTRSVVVAALLVLMLIAPATAHAWKPFTHNYTGDQAYADAIDDGQITIAGQGYAVAPQIVTALENWPEFYNAGVVGPDAFPDIAYGQAIIHPVHTGRWLGYVVRQAWAAQADPTYTNEEKEQILAFAYGFLTHAAGDMWAHTLVNDFAGGVFPEVADVLTNLKAAKIALRHLISEGGYIGSATPGWDNADSEEAFVPGESCNSPDTGPPDTVCNPGTADEETLEASRVCADPDSPPTEGTTCRVEGPFGTMVPDVSLDSSPGITFDAPHKFIQRTMIDLSARTPADGCDASDPDGDGVIRDGCPGGPFSVGEPELTRGPILDFILDEESDLEFLAGKTRRDANHTDCAAPVPLTGSSCDKVTSTVNVSTVRGIRQFNFTRDVCDGICFADVGDEAADVIDGLIASYEEAWVDDIDEMRDHWSEFSLGVMKGIMDPQTLRDAANDDCAFEGPESVTNNSRNACEDGVGHLDAVIYALENFYPTGKKSWIDRYLIPASGLPDAIGDIHSFLTAVGDAIEDVFTTLGIQNPISAILADIEAFVEDKINEFIKDQYGIDIEAISEFVKSPGQWMCGTDVNNPASLTLPPPIGTITPGGIFTPADHARIDTLMGLESDHHEAAPGLPIDCAPLSDDAKFDPEEFAALKNTVTTAKLLLLNGTELNRALGELLAGEAVTKSASVVSNYNDPAGGAPADVMVDGLDASGHASASVPWLELIDGDHAWREDGLPRFCNNDGTGACTPLPPDLPVGTNPTPRPLESEVTGQLNAGNGHFPIWESCLLRPAFRVLYDDWENDDNAFETNFPDLGDKPSADASDPDAPLTTLAAGGTTFTSGGTTFIAADNEFTVTAADDVFTDDFVGLRYRVFLDGTTPGPFVAIDNGDSFSISGPDGLYHVEVQSEDPCHTFDPTDSLGAGTVLGESFVLDTTGPEIEITSPAPEGVVFDTDDVSSIVYTVTDVGSGVASSSVSLDGAPATNGQVLDMFFLAPGLHTIVVTAVDNLGNSSSATRTFEVHATAESLNNNIDRACNLGLIKATLCNALKAKTRAALAAHNRGQHATEHNILRALVHQLEAKRGKGVDAATADRLIAYIEDLIARGG
jgi:hypothetical protein